MGQKLHYRIEMESYEVTPNRIKTYDGSDKEFPIEIVSMEGEKREFDRPEFKEAFDKILRGDRTVFELDSVTLYSNTVMLYYVAFEPDPDDHDIYNPAFDDGAVYLTKASDCYLSLKVERGDSLPADEYSICFMGDDADDDNSYPQIRHRRDQIVTQLNFGKDGYVEIEEERP